MQAKVNSKAKALSKHNAKLLSEEADRKATVKINTLIGQIKKKLISMQDTFNKRDYMSVGVEERTMKTLEIDDAGSIILVRNGIRMSPLRLDQVKAMQMTPP